MIIQMLQAHVVVGFNFIYFGHNSKLVHVLNGGLRKWIVENRKVTTQLPKIEISNYNCLEKNEISQK